MGRVLQFGYNVIIIFSWRLGQKKIYFLPDYVGKKIIVYEKIREKSSVALATHDFKNPNASFQEDEGPSNNEVWIMLFAETALRWDF